MQRANTETPVNLADRPSDDQAVFARRLGALLAVEAATLGSVSGIHLSGVVSRSGSFDPHDAGIAEAIIGAVLLFAAGWIVLQPARARTVGLAATGFATAGFLVGLNFTARAGHAPDLAYHLVMLPVFITTLVVLARRRRMAPPEEHAMST
jgi:multisubunit Na+/H+ antiporter MnhF subunit